MSFAEHEFAAFVVMLKRFAETANVDFRHLKTVAALKIAVSFVAVDEKHVFESVMQQHRDGEAQLDVQWELLRDFVQLQSGTASEDDKFMLFLLSCVKFENEPPLGEELEQHMLKLGLQIQTTAPPALTPIDSTRVALFRVFEDAVRWDDICKAYIIMNTSTDCPIETLASFLESVPALRKGTRKFASFADCAMHVGKHLHSTRYKLVEQEETLISILGACMQTETENAERVLRCSQEQVRAVADDSREKLRRFERPSLSAMVQRAPGAASAKHSSWEKYEAFVEACRFPLSTPPSLRRYVYFLKCMDNEDSGIDTARYIDLLITCPILRANIARNQIVKVDHSVIAGIIYDIRNIGEPLTILKQFRAQCLEQFFSKEEIRLAVNWSVTLKLYVAAYQRPAVFSAIWSQVLKQCASVRWQIASGNQAMGIVRTFVANNQFRDEDVFCIVEQCVRN